MVFSSAGSLHVAESTPLVDDSTRKKKFNNSSPSLLEGAFEEGRVNFESLKQHSMPYDSRKGSSRNSYRKEPMSKEELERLKLEAAQAADQLSMRLLQIDDDDVETEEMILRESLDVSLHGLPKVPSYQLSTRSSSVSLRRYSAASAASGSPRFGDKRRQEGSAYARLCGMIVLILVGGAILVGALWYGSWVVQPHDQPVGPYQLIERQEGEEFFDYYTFHAGADSVGSNGYITYVSAERAKEIAIANITYEHDDLDVYYVTDDDDENGTDGANDGDGETSDTRDDRNRRRHRRLQQSSTNFTKHDNRTEPFLYLKSAPTKAGPRESIRLEGKRRFNRGLFIIDVRHMPGGCGVWPAFWLTDEANWPVNGEIDIVEGVNYQSIAKTALHTTKGCNMYDVPTGTMTGTWDTAVGIPDRKTGIPDMTMREARNCFVYDPHQWLNQGCVAMDTSTATIDEETGDPVGDSLGIPLNKKGGGVFALEWDPVNRHIRSWVFTPHTTVPENLVDAIRTAHFESEEDRIMPDPSLWPIPYGNFPMGDNTNCRPSHFKNMRLVLNTAFCGSVAGNRYFMDCPKQFEEYPTCNAYVKSRPKELEDEAYWKIRGIYVYQRTWEKAWLN